MCIAISSDKKEFVLYQSSTTYIYVNDSGEIKIKAGSTSLESTILGETLKTTLENILDKIIAHSHGSAVGPTSPPTNAADFATIKAGLSSILSPKIKNN